MLQFDIKNRDFYNSLSSDQKKRFSPYLMIRWGATVVGSSDLQEFYIISCNERLNKHFFAVSKHPELQWLMATTVSPNIGSFKHEWIPSKKKLSTSSKIEKFLLDIFPTMKLDDVKVLASITSMKDIKQMAIEHGYSEKEVNYIVK